MLWSLASGFTYQLPVLVTYSVMRARQGGEEWVLLVWVYLVSAPFILGIWTSLAGKSAEVRINE